jgi:steroid 5-alpha reductase family enzyme
MEIDSILSPYVQKRLLLGLAMFFLGLCCNIYADQVLINLRKGRDDKCYYIPQGVLFKRITCPNYFWEIVEWTGLAMIFTNAATVSFIYLTLNNLVPRAVSTHKWYLNKFGDEYPRGRKAIIPYFL